jgi:hypothetical protein
MSFGELEEPWPGAGEGRAGSRSEVFSAGRPQKRIDLIKLEPLESLYYYGYIFFRWFDLQHCRANAL